MIIAINGKRYSNFQSATANIRIDVLSNSFSFAIAPKDKAVIPLKLDDECAIYIGDELILTGYIEDINGSGDASSRIIDITGRDRTSSIVDSSLGIISDIKAPITMKRVVELVIADIGESIDVIDHTGAMFDKAEDIIAIEPGDNAFDYIEKLARKKNVLLSSDSEGNVVIQNSLGVSTSNVLQNLYGDQANNVISYSFNFNNLERFREYKAIGNLNVNTLGTLGATKPKKVIAQSGAVTDQQVREGRQLVISSENASSADSLTNRADWERNFRRARSRSYGAKVSGYRANDGAIWTTNMLVYVRDDYAGISDQMLINEVSYRLDPDGETTELKLINRDAYTLEISEPQEIKAAKKKKKGSTDTAGVIF